MISKETLRKMAADLNSKISEAQIDLVKTQLDKLLDDMGKVPHKAIENVQPEMSYKKREGIGR